MPLEQVFLMDLDVHAKSGTLTDRLVAAGAISQSKINGLPGALSALTASIATEVSRAQAAESVLTTDLAAEISSRIIAVSSVQANLDAINVVLDGRCDVLEGADSVVGSVNYKVKVERDRATAAEAVIASHLSSEIARAIAEEADIRGDFAAADSATLSSAQGYTDTKISQLVNSAPALLDTLGEIATALQAEQSATASILTSISNEVTRATAAEGLLDGRLDVLEAKQWRQALLLTSSLGVTSLAKPAGAPAIPNNGAEVQVFIDGRKVFFGSQFEVAAGGGSISFTALRADQTVEMLYWA
jgi:hypothetical protein